MNFAPGKIPLRSNGFLYSAFPEYSCLAFSTPATFCRCFRFLQFPTLHFCAADSFLAVSTPCILVPLFHFPFFHVLHFQHPHPCYVFNLCKIKQTNNLCRFRRFCIENSWLRFLYSNHSRHWIVYH